MSLQGRRCILAPRDAGGCSTFPGSTSWPGLGAHILSGRRLKPPQHKPLSRNIYRNRWSIGCARQKQKTLKCLRTWPISTKVRQIRASIGRFRRNSSKSLQNRLISSKSTEFGRNVDRGAAIEVPSREENVDPRKVERESEKLKVAPGAEVPPKLDQNWARLVKYWSTLANFDEIGAPDWALSTNIGRLGPKSGQLWADLGLILASIAPLWSSCAETCDTYRSKLGRTSAPATARQLLGFGNVCALVAVAANPALRDISVRHPPPNLAPLQQLHGPVPQEFSNGQPPQGLRDQKPGKTPLRRLRVAAPAHACAGRRKRRGDAGA